MKDRDFVLEFAVKCVEYAGAGRFPESYARGMWQVAHDLHGTSEVGEWAAVREQLREMLVKEGR